MTYDQLALRVILSGDDAALRRLYKHAQSRFGDVCPCCGSTDIEQEVGSRSFQCVETDCRHTWEG